MNWEITDNHTQQKINRGVKNLFDKAISKFDKKATKAKSISTYDSSSLNFNLLGGPIHSELLIATASLKIGENAGQQLPLMCKWYCINSINGEAREIEGVNGAFYQPCADDVGSKISVFATPSIDEGHYVGNPVQAEVGPLVLDKEVEKRADELLKNNSCYSVARIESINFNYDTKLINLPCEGRIAINTENFTITIYAKNTKIIFGSPGITANTQSPQLGEKLISCDINDQYPYVQSYRKTNNVFEVHLSPNEVIRFASENNIERDVIAISMKMCVAKKLLQSQVTYNIQDGNKEPESLDENPTPEQEQQQQASVHTDEKSKIEESPPSTEFQILSETPQKIEETSEDKDNNKTISEVLISNSPSDKNTSSNSNATINLSPLLEISPQQQQQQNPPQLSTFQLNPQQVPNQTHTTTPTPTLTINPTLMQSPLPNQPDSGLIQPPSTPSNQNFNFLIASQQSNRKNEISNVEILMKMEQMSKDLLKLTKEKENLMRELASERENCRVYEAKHKEMSYNLELLNTSLQEILTENDNIKRENEKLLNEKLFFQQDITLYKTQLQDLKEIIEHFNYQSSESSTNTSTNPNIQNNIQDNQNAQDDDVALIISKSKSRISIEKQQLKDNYEGIIIELKAKIATLELENADLKSELEKSKENISQLSNAKEELESQNNHLNKKYQCLSQEKDKLAQALLTQQINTTTNANITINNTITTQKTITTTNTNPSNAPTTQQLNNSGDGGKASSNSSGLVTPNVKSQISESPAKGKVLLTNRLSELEEKQRDKDRIQILEEELKELKEKTHKVFMENETLKLSKELEDKKHSKRSFTRLFSGSSNNSSIANNTNSHDTLDYLQKLVNSLTETITEKEFAIESQRQVNKQLAKRILELELELKNSINPNKENSISEPSK